MRSTFLAFSIAVFAGSAPAEAPHWWIARGVLDTNAVPNDYAPANQGQAKWMAVQAAAELDRRLPNGAGAVVAGMVGRFTPAFADAPLNLGQLKSLAAPFYDRIRAEGFAAALPSGLPGVYPWTESVSDDADFALVNLGQLKHVFSFDLDLCFDTDGDGLPDGVEFRWGLDANDASDAGRASADPQAHGLTYLEVHENPGVQAAGNHSTAGDGIPDSWKIRWGYAVGDAGVGDLDEDGDGRTAAREYELGSNPHRNDELVWFTDAGRVEMVKGGFEEFLQSEPPLRKMYERQVTTWSDWIVPPWEEFPPAGEGGVVVTYDVGTDTYGAVPFGRGEQHVWPPAVESPTRMAGIGETWTCCGGCLMDAAGMWYCPNHRGEQEVEIRLEDEFTTPEFVAQARARLGTLPGVFQQTFLDEFDGSRAPTEGPDPIGDWFDAAYYDLSADETALVAGRIRYKFRLDSAPGNRSLHWIEVFVPKDDPATPADESAQHEYAFRCWPDEANPDTGQEETPVYVIDPLAAAAPRPGQYRIVILPPGRMVPDYDRDGRIDGRDVRVQMAGKPFRIWINDDRDVGDESTEAFEDAPAGSCDPEAMPAPIGGRPRNCMDGVVNGLRDLVDFFPVHLDVPLDRLPPGDYTYRLRQEHASVKYVYTSLPPEDAGRVHAGIVSNCGAKSAAWLASAPTVWPESSQPCPGAVLPYGTGPLDPDWIREHRVLLIEGARASTDPLVFEVRRGDELVYSCRMPLSVSPVRDMFRYLNIRTCDKLFTEPDQTLWTPFSRDTARVGRWPTALGQPANLPDGWLDAPGEPVRTLVAIHGLDWDHEESPAGHAEIFKRFFQSGCRARYIGVSWAADCGRRLGMPVIYYTDVIGAFVAAHYVKEGLQGFWGPDTVVFAHSLGNVVASSMIADHGARVGKYLMINAAVPSEAYDGTPAWSNAVAMVPPTWKTSADGPPTAVHPEAYMASHWNALFSGADPRSSVRWGNRFAALAGRTNVYDFYSSGEEILKQPDGKVPDLGVPMTFLIDALNRLLPSAIEISRARDAVTDSEGVWVYSEMTKGCPARLTDTLFLRHNHGGWGFRDGVPVTSNPIGLPIFRPFESEDARCPKWEKAETWLYRPDGDPDVRKRLPALPFTSEPAEAARIELIKSHAKLLAEAIPSLSGPVGGRALTRLDLLAQNINMQEKCRDPALWPARAETEKPGRWLHSDYKNAAHVYVYRLYQHCSKLIDGERP